MKVSRLLAAASMLAAMTVVDGACALTVADYEAQRDSADPEVRIAQGIYLLGLGNGFTYANAALATGGQRPLYCAPPKLALNEDNYRRIIDEALRKAREDGRVRDEEPVELFLLIGLSRTFPCA
ncbi:hypothetical protein EIM50_09460 [Pseudoxanthomonas sp. SGD-10]|nr:hypothetical protein EIM50_09460 [Pseudoxanthomonas sp. SGD-10]